VGACTPLASATKAPKGKLTNPFKLDGSPEWRDYRRQNARELTPNPAVFV